MSSVVSLSPSMSRSGRRRSSQRGSHHTEVERLVALGATTVDDWDYEDGADYIVLRDPDGNTFCIVSD